MPFSSTPVYVNNGDNIQIRYVTPDYWNENVTVNVQIGTGSDPDGITFGTKIPDATPNSFNFTNQAGYTGSFNGTASSGFVNTFQRDTYYYSQVIDISSIEVPIPATISAVDSGPKNSNTTNSTAEFRIYRNGGFDSWRTSITANYVNGTGGLRPGDKIQLRVKTANWYTTATTVTFTVSDETWGTNLGLSAASFSRTWSITTRKQDNIIPSYQFTDRVDAKIPADGGVDYYTQDIPISSIDGDVVLRATSTGDVTIRKNGSGSWVTSLTGLVLGDTVNTRIVNGPAYTQKTSGGLSVFAVDGDTLAGGYENNTSGTYGSTNSYGSYQVVQDTGNVSDDWQVWTEVDRYPNDIAALPIFTYNIQTNAGQPGFVTGSGFIFGTTYDTTTTGSGSGMKVKQMVGSLDNFATGVFIVDPGYGYQPGDVITVPTPNPSGTDAQFTIEEYQKITVSTTSSNTLAEAGFMYFSDIAISGLGTEYAAGSYDNLETPLSGTSAGAGTIQNTVAITNGQTVKINAIIDGTAGEIRKNNTGAWVQQLAVENNDVLNVKRNASSTYGATSTCTVKLQGPPSGNPATGNPTQGPSTPTYADKTATMTLVTRPARNTPYTFHADPVYQSNPGQEHIAQVQIDGLDVTTTATIESGVGTLSRDGVNWGGSITLQPTDTILYVRQTASVTSGAVQQLTYKVGTVFDTFRIYTGQFNNEGDFVEASWQGDNQVNFIEYEIPAFGSQFFYLTLVGAGGGKGGDDAPNSEGGPGGNGNIFRGTVSIPSDAWPLNAGGEPDYKIRVYAPDHGLDGLNYVQGSGGGAGGFGYAYGGAGGASGPSDKSGGGGGGGGAAAITFSNNVLIAMAGGGGGGAGAGGDTTIPTAEQYGNYNGYGNLSTSTLNLNLPGDDAPNATGEGGGPGGGGGGYDGSAGVLLTQKLDPSGGVIQTSDLDATGGNGGGVYYNSTYVTPLSSAQPSGLGAPGRNAGAVYIEFPQQDISPNPYSFSEVDNVPINSQAESNIVQITGITGAVPIQLSSPGFNSVARVCSGPTAGTCGPWGATAISNNEYLQLRATVGALYNTTYTVNVTVGNIPANWNINTGEPPDTEPAPYFFTDVTNANLSTLVYSEEITISGITVPVTVNATNGAEVSINGAAYVSGVTDPTIENGQTLRIRLTSPSGYESTSSTDITVGTGDTVTWSVSTGVEADSTPGSFSWITVTGADLQTQYESNTVLIQGIDTQVDFIVESGAGDGDPSGQLPEIKKNDVLLGPTVTQTTLENFDTVALVYTTSSTVGETRVFNTKTGLSTSTAGYFETAWNVITAGQFGTDPDPFAFTPQIASGPGVYTESAETRTVSGLSTGISVALFTSNNMEVSINGGAYNLYTLTSPASVSNGTTIRVRLFSSQIEGFTRTAQLYVGSFNTSFSVQTPAALADPIFGQWYSSITPVKYVGTSQIRYSAKLDGMPVGAMMPVFQDSTQSDGWGTLDGKLNSRYHGFMYCNGEYLNPNDYPALYSVIGYDYGAKAVGSDTYFRLPDMRNRYVKGTGVVDGNQLSSPALTPEYKRTKQSGAPGNEEPGSFGGYWFVNNIGDPSVGEIDQVATPATGQPAQDSDFFGIATVTTTGYSDVQGIIEFFTLGEAVCPVSLKEEKIYDVPLHFHEMVAGQADPGDFKGRINWGGAGGYSQDVQVGTNNVGSSTAATFSNTTTIAINLWGYHTDDYNMDSSNLPDSSYCNNTPAWWNGSTSQWGDGTNPGYQGTESMGSYGSVTVNQANMKSGGANYNEVDDYIDLANSPFSGNSGTAGGSGDALKWLASIDIPRKEITVKSYSPTQKLKHNHYLSYNVDPKSIDNVYGYGNNETGGTTSSALNTFSGGVNSSVNVVFKGDDTAINDLGIQVLPGTFTLSQSKQLVPTPALDPQDDVPLVSPYTWVKWMIKAF